MLDNTITLGTAASSGGSLTDQAYTRYREGSNKTTYIGAGHSDQTPNTMLVQTSDPVVQGSSAGVRQSRVSFKQSVPFTNLSGESVKGDAIFTIVATVPVGMSDADFELLRSRLHAFATDATLLSRLAVTGEV